MHRDHTERILQAFFKVYNNLGYGFLEKVYENAISIEIERRGGIVERQKRVSVYYERKIVGEYIADLLVDGLVIVEVKAVEILRLEHHAQVLNYLRATTVEIGMLLNFGRKPEYHRKIFTNDRKNLQYDQ
jgi:GxxExxY protein